MKTRQCQLCKGKRRLPTAPKFTCIACSGRGFEYVPANGTPGPKRLAKIMRLG